MRAENSPRVLVIGGGVTGLTLALSLHQAGVACRVYEAASELKWLGVGINLLPHAVRERPGADALVLGARCEGVAQDETGVTVRFAGGASARGSVAVGCDGIHSAVRRALYPDEGSPLYTNINMWRGVTRWPPFLTGASFVQCGWLDVGKIVIYPIRPDLDAEGRQLLNWTAEFRSPRNVQADWNLNGSLEDFLPVFESFRFRWLDVPEMLRHAEVVLEYPMVDRDPLARWSFGRVTLVGDAAHPMYPRGANGAAQGILDARALAGCLKRERNAVAALKSYEDARLAAANAVVLAGRSTSPDTILRIVHERTGDKPFGRIEDVLGADEIAALMEDYKRVAGFEREALNRRASLVS